MRTKTLGPLLSLVLLLLGVGACCPTQHRGEALAVRDSSRVVVAYVTSWGQRLPDPSLVTHVNYAFAHVTDDYRGVRIDSVPRLREVVGLRRQNPSLKVLLSVGGWGSSRFSEMAATDSTRRAFAADCRRVVDRFDLDGIDLDWEYPGVPAAGISASPQDTAHLTLLLRDLRQALGTEHWLTLATDARARYYRLREALPYLDYVNIMSYDMAEAPLHHAALYPSAQAPEGSCAQAVEAHLAAGVPPHRLVLGIPFYGHGTHEAPEDLSYRQLLTLDSLEHRWDSVAQAPFLVHRTGRYVVCYDNPRSIAAKCRFLKTKGLRGAMYWECSHDDDRQSLARAVYEGVLQSPQK